MNSPPQRKGSIVYRSYSSPVFFNGEEPYILTDEKGQIVAQGMRPGDISDEIYAALDAGHSIQVTSEQEYIAMVDKLGYHKLAEQIVLWRREETTPVQEPYVMTP